VLNYKAKAAMLVIHSRLLSVLGVTAELLTL